MQHRDMKLGLVLDPEFYILEKSVAAVTIPLVRSLIGRFDTHIIYDQNTYDRFCTEVDFLISLEPKWAAPVLNWRRAGRFCRSLPPCPCYVMMSDPHIEQWREDYFLKQNLDYILALYYQPTRNHFRRVPVERIVHFPWAIPDEWISGGEIAYHGQEKVVIFGASQSDAYTVRNWCRQQPGVQSFDYSGVENKVLAGEEFFKWLQGFDAVVAAGSEDTKYRLTTPKYFETAAAGSLLFAQATDDLPRLGFQDGENCIIFSQANFRSRVETYLADHANERWLSIRRMGREFIRKRHTISVRLDMLEVHVRQWQGRG